MALGALVVGLWPLDFCVPQKYAEIKPLVDGCEIGAVWMLQLFVRELDPSSVVHRPVDKSRLVYTWRWTVVFGLQHDRATFAR